MNNILTLIAATPEYGKEMQSVGIEPQFIGVGPIEASFNTTRLLLDNIHQGKKPDFVLSLGTAGSSTLEQAEIYQVKHVSYRDMDASAFGFQKGVTPFAPYGDILELETMFDDIPKIHLSTGAKVIAHNEFKNIHADAVDMETYAIKRVCDFFNIPLIGIRGISDGKEPSSGYKTWEEYLEIIDNKMANIYKKLILQLEKC